MTTSNESNNSNKKPKNMLFEQILIDEINRSIQEKNGHEKIGTTFTDWVKKACKDRLECENGIKIDEILEAEAEKKRREKASQAKQKREEKKRQTEKKNEEKKTAKETREGRKYKNSFGCHIQRTRCA